MRDHLDVIACDTPGCEASISGPAGPLRRRAEEAGWQVGAVTAMDIDDDGPELTREDHCPAHHVAAYSRDEVLREAGGPGGIQVWDL